MQRVLPKTIRTEIKGGITMNFNEYQEATRRTASKDASEERRISNYVFGLNGEVGEVTDYLKKFMYHDHTLDADELEKELGDCLWYLARLSDEFGIELSNVAEKNIEKLKKRYPQGFNVQDSINREV